jgi:cytochrome c553
MKIVAAFLLLALPALPLGVFAQAPDVTTCAGCHGAKGEGNPALNAPRIAAQPADYLLRQLQAYASGNRRNAVMEPIAKGLTPEQRRLMAAHYATLDAGASIAKAKSTERGRKLATVGDGKLQIQACVNCHGPDGIGEPPLNPYIAGQLDKYLAASLQEWKSGARNTDPSLQMPLIGAKLSSQDINALSQYYASLPAPAPRLLEGRAPRVVGGAPAPAVASEPAKGVGVEQGAPTTGGAQGPGGGGAASGTGAQGTPQTPKR